MDDRPDSTTIPAPAPPAIPSMADLEGLSSELDSVDRTLADLDGDSVQNASQVQDADPASPGELDSI